MKLLADGVAHSLHGSTIDGQWLLLGVASLEVSDNLFGLANNYPEVAIPAPRSQQVDLLPVMSLIAFGNETHQSCVVLCVMLPEVLLQAGAVCGLWLWKSSSRFAEGGVESQFV